MSINDRAYRAMDLVHSSKHTASGEVVGRGGFVRGLVIAQGTGDGNIKLRDGGASGTVLVDIDTTNDKTLMDITIPGSGVQFNTDLYIEITAVNAVTVFYN